MRTLLKLLNTVILITALLISGNTFAFSDFDKHPSIVGTVYLNKIEPLVVIEDTVDKHLYIYKEGQVIYTGKDFSNYIEITSIKDNSLVVFMPDKNDKLFFVSKNNYLPDSKRFKFKDLVNVHNLQIAYIESSKNSEFRLSEINGDSITLTREYSPVDINKKPRLQKELFENIKVKENKYGEIVIDKESAQAAFNNTGEVIKSVLSQSSVSMNSERKFTMKFESYLGKVWLNETGVLIKKFYLRRLPSKLGFKQGDLITRFNGRKVNSLWQIYSIYKEIKENQSNLDTVELELVRDGKVMRKKFRIR